MLQESFMEKRKEYLVRLNSLSTKELEVFIIEAKLDNKFDTITNPKNKKELDIANAYFSIYKDEIILKKIIEKNKKIIKIEDNIFLKALISIYKILSQNSIYEKDKILKKILPFNTQKKKLELLGKIKVHSVFMHTYKEELDEYLNKRIKEKDLKLLLESESKILSLLNIEYLDSKEIKNYAKGYHQTLIEYQNKLNV